jgi:hypothetical protein
MSDSFYVLKHVEAALSIYKLKILASAIILARGKVTTRN